VTAEALGQGTVRKEARYLRPFLSWTCSASPEVKERITCTWAAFWAFAAVWRRRSDIALKQILFRSVLLQTLLSGLSALVLHEGDYQRLQSTCCTLARKCLAGLASCKHIDKNTYQMIYEAWSNSRVLQFMGCGDMLTELGIARVRILQKAIRAPERHTMFLASMFSLLLVENAKEDLT